MFLVKGGGRFDVKFVGSGVWFSDWLFRYLNRGWRGRFVPWGFNGAVRVKCRPRGGYLASNRHPRPEVNPQVWTTKLSY